MRSFSITGDRNGCVWRHAADAVRAARESGIRAVVYVPEQYTLQAEKDLISGLKLEGLIDIDVISPSKLRMTVKEYGGSGGRRLLDAPGAAMAVRQAMAELEKELVYYREISGSFGMPDRIRDALEELRDSGITREELADMAEKAVSGAERAKYHDMALIWQRYEELLASGFEDSRISWTETVTRLEGTGLMEGAAVVVYGFDTVRPDLRELLVRAADLAESVTVLLTMDRESADDGRLFSEQRRSAEELRAALAEKGIKCSLSFERSEREKTAPELRWLESRLFSMEQAPWEEDPGDAITMFAASGPFQEAQDIAETLVRWNGEGTAWDRMAVALPRGSETDSVLLAALRLRGIPFSDNRRYPAAAHGVCRLLLGALRIIRDGYSTENILTMVRSGFSGLNGDEISLLEGYAAANGIDRNKWRKQFTRGDNAAEAEELRKRLTEPLETMRAELRSAGRADRSVQAVVNYLLGMDISGKLKEREELLIDRGMVQEAVINRQIWNMLMELLDELWALLGGRRATLAGVADLIESALSGMELATLPGDGGVSIGVTGHMIPGETDALIIADLNEGYLSAEDTGWLTGTERNRLETASGKSIGMSRDRMLTLRQYDFYRTVSIPDRKLKMTWSLKSEDGKNRQPDGIIEVIRSLFPRLGTGGGILSETRTERPRTPMSAMNGLSDLLRDMKNGAAEDIPEEWKNALRSMLADEKYSRVMEKMLDRLAGDQPDGKDGIRRDTAARLFMTDRISISRLERFASCPYRHFVDYGLRPEKSVEFDFLSTDAGNFFHAALDAYLKRAGAEESWPGLPDSRIDEIMDRICAEQTAEWEGGPLTEDALGIWQGEEYQRRIRFAARAVTRFAENSDFITAATELPFGEQDGLPPTVITLRDGSRTAIRGIIDRVDIFRHGADTWIRVVDNKSSAREPDPAKMATGEQLQLMIYLKAAVNGIKGARPAAAMFFPVQDLEIEADSDDSSELDAARLEKVRMKGVVTADREVLTAIDRDISPFSTDQALKKDGTIRTGARWAVTESVMNGLMDAAEKTAARLCSDIKEGKTDVSPIGDGDKTTCTYCEYSSICHVGPGDVRIRDRNITYQDAASDAE